MIRSPSQVRRKTTNLAFLNIPTVPFKDNVLSANLNQFAKAVAVLSCIDDFSNNQDDHYWYDDRYSDSQAAGCSCRCFRETVKEEARARVSDLGKFYLRQQFTFL
jgi:hypothetical protein